LPRLVSGVPEDLGAIVRKCLHKNPAQRYQTAAELADDLARFLAGRPTKARPLALPERCSRWIRRHESLVALLALATTAAALCLGLFWLGDRLLQTQDEVKQTQERLGRANERAKSRALFLAQQAYANDLTAAGKSTAQGDIPRAMEALRRQEADESRPD